MCKFSALLPLADVISSPAILKKRFVWEEAPSVGIGRSFFWDLQEMVRTAFIRRVQRFCRKTGRSMSVDYTKGKGSHARITVNGKTTTIKDGDLSPAYVALLLRQLEIPRDALD
jgi:hypothetical protein